MGNLNLWLINLFDEFPGAAGEYPARVVGLAEELERRGHAVTWWTTDWSHRYKRRRQAPKPHGRLRIRALPCVAYRSNTSLRRLWSHHYYARRLRVALRQALRNGEMPDAVYVNLPVPTVAAVAAELKEAAGFRLVVDIRDAWPENFLQLLPGGERARRLFGPVLLWPFRRAARRAYRAADVLTAVSRDYLEMASRYGMRNGQVFYIGTPPDRLESQPPAMTARDPGGPLRLVYIGGFGTSYDLATLGEAVRQGWPAAGGDDSEQPVEVHLAGYGQPPAWAREATGVVFHGMLGAAELRALLEWCHVGLNAVHGGSGIAMPNKVGDYLAAGLPLVHARESGELAELVREREMGSCYRAGDVAGLVQAVGRYRGAEGERRLEAESWAARAFAVAALDRRKIYAGLADVVVGSFNGGGRKEEASDIR